MLDEPFSGLDPLNVELVQEVILERRAREQTTILSTHQMDRVEALCDRVALIDAARLMVYDKVEALRRRYSLPEVRLLVRGELEDVAGVIEARPEGEGRFHLRLEAEAQPSRVLRSLVEAGVAVEAFEPVLARMNEIFLQVVDRSRRQ